MASIEPMSLRRIWIVDDSALEAKHAAAALTGFATEIFPDGESMIERHATVAPPAAIVLDWVMPGMSGLDVVRFLRGHAEPLLRHLPVLLLTVESRAPRVAEGLEAGANDFLRKPYEPVELRARVDALLRGAALLERATRAERELRSLLVHSPDPLVVVDDADLVTFANARARDAFGADVTGTSFSTLVPGLSIRGLSLREIAAGGAELPPLPDVAIRGRSFSPTVRALFDDGGLRATISLRDVTDRRRAEERKLDFYSVVAHDLRTPISAMLLRTELLLRGKRGTLDDAALEEVRRLQTGMRATSSLVNDFLDVARLEAKAEEVGSTTCDLAAVADAVCSELRPLAEAKQLELRLAPSSGPMLVRGSEPRLSQVLTNLVANAIKFTPSQGTVEVALVAEERFVRASVKDTGPGVPPVRIPGLFDRFTRGMGPAAGSGLGLMIVKATVDAHGGTVGVESEEGVGATFWFRIPAA